jgi:hypothetical protein
MICDDVRDLTDYEELIQRACAVADTSREMVATARDAVARCQETLRMCAATRDAARQHMASARRAMDLRRDRSVMNQR